MTKLGLGIDSGSTTTKGVLYDGTRAVETVLLPTGGNPKKSLRAVYEQLYREEVAFTVTTGYGRALLPEADKSVTEITCHAKGATLLCPGCGSIVDIGGQDCKVILLDEQGAVTDFLMNDKCAAGTGRFMDAMCRTLELERTKLDTLLCGAKPVEISSMCTVFAESEMVSLLAAGAEARDIALGMVHAICKRTANFAGRLQPRGPVFFSGGLAGIEVFRSVLEEQLQLQVVTHPMSQLTGALGAAAIAYERGSRSGIA